MEPILFTKMQGIGNDYVYIDCLSSCPRNLASLSREMSDRHYGVGGDGIILILPSCEADFKMRIFNADGSEALMCGNGARCVAKYVYDNNLTHSTHVTLETLSGVKHLFLKPGHDGLIESVTVDMGLPSLLTEHLPVDDCLTATAVSMGNPHAVIFVDDADKADVATIGKRTEIHPYFPDRTNVEFVSVMSPTDLRMRVWERGSGITLACGTGACASLVAANVCGLTGRQATIHLDGGKLDVVWDESTGHVMLTGPATTVFKGTYFRQIG